MAKMSEELAAVDVVATRRDVDIFLQVQPAKPPPACASAYWPLRGAAFVGVISVALFKPVAWFVLGLEVIAFGMELHLRRRARSRMDYPLEMMSGRYAITPDGLWRTNDLSAGLLRWHAVVVRQVDEYFIVKLSGIGWIIPFRCFESTEARERFGHLLGEFAGK